MLEAVEPTEAFSYTAASTELSTLPKGTKRAYNRKPKGQDGKPAAVSVVDRRRKGLIVSYMYCDMDIYV